MLPHMSVHSCKAESGGLAEMPGSCVSATASETVDKRRLKLRGSGISAENLLS